MTTHTLLSQIRDQVLHIVLVAIVFLPVLKWDTWYGFLLAGFLFGTAREIDQILERLRLGIDPGANFFSEIHAGRFLDIAFCVVGSQVLYWGWYFLTK